MCTGQQMLRLENCRIFCISFRSITLGSQHRYILVGKLRDVQDNFSDIIDSNIMREQACAALPHSIFKVTLSSLANSAAS